MKKTIILMPIFGILTSAFLVSCGDDEMIYENEHEYIENSLPEGNPGTEDMYGFYLCTTQNELLNSLNQSVDRVKDYFEDSYNNDIDINYLGINDGLATKGIVAQFQNALNKMPNVIRIENEKEIYSLHQYVTINNNFQKKQFFWRNFDVPYCVITSIYHRKYSYYVPISITCGANNYPDYSESLEEWSGYYSLNGDKMLVNTDESGIVGTHKSYEWSYRNGTITITKDDGNTLIYEKYNQ